MGGWEPYPLAENRKIPDQLLRTLVAGKDPEGRNPPPWYHRACLQAFAESSTSGHINTRYLIDKHTPQSPVAKFLRRVQSVVWERVFFQSQKEEHFGLGPNEARRGDLICILYGCTVPVILREIEDSVNPYYELIGECYVDGLMDGEATETEPPPKTMMFKLG